MNYHAHIFGTTVTIAEQDVDVTVSARAGDGEILRIVRDDTHEDVYRVLSPETRASIKRMGIDGQTRTLTELERALFSHDWNYQYSKFAGWKRGQEEWQTILDLCAQLPEAQVRAAWDKYGEGPYPFEDRRTA